MNNINSVEYEIDILDRINKNKDNIRQRDISKWFGISLGMTNVILKRLVNKGLLKIQKVNNRNIKYLVSPKGIEAIAKRSFNYFKNTVKSVVNYKEFISDLLGNIKKNGYTGISLIGSSDIDFIIEYICSKSELKFSREIKQDFFIIYSEDYIPDENSNIDQYNSIALREIVINL
jgi:predicted transcriptional regulator